MSAPSADVDIPLEPDVDIELEAAPASETVATVDDSPAASGVASRESGPENAVDTGLATLPLMEVLSADFPLPLLTKFVPDARLKLASDEAARHALAIEVTGAEGLQRADYALTSLRACQKRIEESFAEPTEIANRLHKRLTSVRGEWLESGAAALKTVNGRVYTEQQRLERIAADERRKAQEDADRQTREARQREADAAAKQHAPPEVVEELQRQAETATAPPVPTPTPAPVLQNSTTVTTWKARLAGSHADADPNPKMADVPMGQRRAVFDLLRAIVDGKAPITALELNWAVLNARAKSDKSTLAIPGIEAFADGSVRAKGRRG